jgi:alpha-tubulin suppressor-like RCC1 family protein
MPQSVTCQFLKTSGGIFGLPIKCVVALFLPHSCASQPAHLGQFQMSRTFSAASISFLLAYLFAYSQATFAVQPKVYAGYLHGYALSENGVVYSWGGGGTNLPGGAVPVVVSGLPPVVEMAAGYSHAIALTSSGQIYTWGVNTNGELGRGTVGGSGSATPALVPGLANVIAIAAGYRHSLVLLADGTVWAWGHNDYGQLGTGDLIPSGSPRKIAGLDNVVRLGATGYADHSLAVKSDGTVMAWGKNVKGQLGDGTKVNRMVPVQVTGLTNAIDARPGQQHSAALLNDGSVWTWGYGGSGVLGNRDTNEQLAPVQVYESQTTPLASITDISVGESFTLATKNDRSVWAWGSSVYGNFGNGIYNSANYAIASAPLQNMRVSAGDNYAIGLHDDGSVWAWGRNFRQELGDNSPIIGGSQQGLPIPVHGIANVGFLTLKSSAPNRWLHVAVTGKGKVTSSIGAMDCPTVCMQNFPQHTSVTLTATPTTYTLFSGWSGACSGTGTCTVTLNSTQSATANFVYRKVSLTVANVGGGSGRITMNSGAINCGVKCSTLLDAGVQDYVFAQADPGSVLLGWTVVAGIATCGNGTCTVLPDAPIILNAIFALTTEVPGPPIRVSAFAGSSQALLYADVPLSDGGHPIIGFTVLCNPASITGASATLPVRVSGLTNDVVYSCTVAAKNAVGTGTFSAAINVTPSASIPFSFLGAVSRKTHSTAGTFDISLAESPRTASDVTVEPRGIGNHKIVFRFNRAVNTVGSATVTDSAQALIGTRGLAINGSDIEVNLFSIPDGRYVTVSLNGVNGTLDVSARVAFLFGSFSATGSVVRNDVSATRTYSGRRAYFDNFKHDVNVSGLISAADVVSVNKRLGNYLQ